jgi:hypothetical protein
MLRRAAVILLVAAACTTHDGPDASTDAADGASFDSSTHRDASDAGHDAPPDSPDTAPPDGWIRISGSFPERALVAVASPALVAATHFPVETCPDRSGCRRIVQTWPSGDCTAGPAPCGAFSAGEANGNHDGTTGLVILGRQSSQDVRENWVVDDQGNARAGFLGGTYPAPAFGAVDVDATSVLLSVYAGAVGADFETFAMLAPIDSPLTFTDLGEVNHITAGADVVQRWQLGSSAIAAETTGLVVMRIPRNGSAGSVVTDGEGTLGTIVGSTILFVTLRITNDIRVARTGSPAEVLIDGPQSHAYRVATDGLDLVWLEWDVDGSGMATHTTAWTASYAEEAAAIAGRVIDTPDWTGVSSPITVGFGYAGGVDAPGGTGGIRVYRLADGYHADIAPSADEVWFSPDYIGPTEIAVASHRLGDFAATTQLCFIELASLDWQPPP